MQNPERKLRIIRIFVSSTFKDMKDEREELIKRVFPRLRKICEERGVTWGAVDLRWGITDEQFADGKAVQMCLEQVGECGPFFIGILGERYGFIPDSLPDELLAQEPWLKEQSGKSVTELEIMRGALNDPGAAKHAYFYFRDPAYLDSLQEVSEPDNPGKMASLKSRIRQSGLPVRENYANPKVLGTLVYDDFVQVIDQLFPSGSEFDPLDRDRLDHEIYAYSKTKVYIGRKEYYDRLDQHVHDNSQPLIILGESGSGKSALLANWAAKLARENSQHLVISHFIGATPYSADWSAMLMRIMGELKLRFRITEEIPGDQAKLKAGFANWLHIASSAAGRENIKVILILDALNQLDDRDQAPDLVWLPPYIPENIRLILSTLPGRSLENLKKRNWPAMSVDPLSDPERTELMKRYLKQYQKELSQVRENRIIASEQTRNPLFLRSLLEELRIFGVHQHLDRAIEHYISSNSIPDLYKKVLKRLEADYEREWPNLVEDTMTLIWASRRGLSEEELFDLLGAAGNRLPHSQWIQFYSAVESLFVGRYDLIEFAHDYIRQAIRDRYLEKLSDQLNAHMRLVDYFSNRNIDPRKVSELPWQLIEAKCWNQLAGLLSDLEFFRAAWEENQFEVKAYWAKIETESEFRLIDAFRRLLDEPAGISNTETIMYASDLLNETGHPAEAFSLLEVLSSMYRESCDYRQLSVTIRKQGIVLWYQCEYDKALELYKEQERICSEMGDMSGISKSLNNQGNILYQWGDYDGAMELYREDERICRELDDKYGLSNCLNNQGIILKKRGDYSGAMKLYKEDESICRELGDKRGLGYSLNNQGNILFQFGDYDGAMALYKEQERTCRELGDKFGLAYSLGNQAGVLIKSGDIEGAVKFFKEKERICQELGDSRGAGFFIKTIRPADRALGLLYSHFRPSG